MEIHEMKWVPKKRVPKIKTKSVRECLQPNLMSRFQDLATEIRNILILKGDQKEVGKASKSPNLPASIDPIFTSFGYAKKYPFNVGEILSGESLNYLGCHPDCTPLPGEQRDRKYNKPFDKFNSFGRSSHADHNGGKAQKLLYWCKQSQDSENAASEPKKYYSCTELRYKQSNPHLSSIQEALREAPVNEKLIKLKQCLSHLNAIRLLTKKRDYDFNFPLLKDHLYCLDKDKTTTIKLDIFYDILKKVKIKPDKEMFEFFLKEFNLLKGDSVCYVEALDLLNWRYEFPTLSKIEDVPKEFQHYKTTYQDTMLDYKT